MAREKSQAAELVKHRIGQLKKLKPRDEAAIAEATATYKTLAAEARDAAGKAEAIQNAAYDLKAVNPNRKAIVDSRTPTELMNLIEATGREVAAALARLRELSTTIS